MLDLKFLPKYGIIDFPIKERDVIYEPDTG